MRHRFQSLGYVFQRSIFKIWRHFCSILIDFGLNISLFRVYTQNFSPRISVSPIRISLSTQKFCSPNFASIENQNLEVGKIDEILTLFEKIDAIGTIVMVLSEISLIFDVFSNILFAKFFFIRTTTRSVYAKPSMSSTSPEKPKTKLF